jgi:hypothetical protein
MSISDCINNLKILYTKDEHVKKIIVDFPKLEQTLNDLESLVEMYAVKRVIVKHIQMLIVSAYKSIVSGKSIEECHRGHMLHTVFYGNPGVGKSRTARYLAEVWKALGILNSQVPTEKITIGETLTQVNNIRSSFLDLYEKSKLNPKSTAKQTDLWDDIKHNLKNLGDNLAKHKSDKVLEKNTKDDLIIVCGREDFVAEYSGQTSIKTHNFLMKHLGKCIIIEEAYLLYNGDSDTYGMEAITVLNRFMDEYSESLIIIFTGYEELLQKTIFKAQPGLKRRCQWIFNLQGYSSEGVSSIFLNQLRILEWDIDKSINLIDFFSKRMDSFPNYGGDTERLALHCKMIHAEDVFKNMISHIDDNKKINSENLKLIITQEMLELSYNEYLKHSL